MVSIVMPETGLRAVVAMALAATEAKKKEKTSVNAVPMPDDGPRHGQTARERQRTPIALTSTPRKIEIMEHRDRCALPGDDFAAAEGAQRDAERTGDDLQRLDDAEDPAVAMAPTPMKRT